MSSAYSIIENRSVHDSSLALECQGGVRDHPESTMDEVVRVHYPQPRVAVVELADRANSNLLTKPLVQGLGRAFVQFGREPELRAVVVHGYDSFFCTGGTKEDLIGVFE